MKTYAITMGRTKQFESDVVNDTLKQARRRKSVVPHAGTPYQNQTDGLDLSDVVDFVRTRLWRTILALLLRLQTLTFGLFRTNGSIKLIFLGACAYFLLFSENAWMVEHRRTFFSSSASSGGGGKKSTLSMLNDAAPIAVDELAEAQAREYIERYAPIAVAEMKKYGIPASISLAQGLVESRAGHSTLARKNNNHFGIKCFSRKCKKGHCSNHTDDTHKDFFRKFPSAWESWRAHSQMLAQGRYTVLQKHGNNYRAWAEGLKELGYATDRKYDVKLIGMIERYDLSRFD
jgi:flagellum-specific peptidoglycan hydrolase FlgJ